MQDDDEDIGAAAQLHRAYERACARSLRLLERREAGDSIRDSVLDSGRFHMNQALDLLRASGVEAVVKPGRRQARAKSAKRTATDARSESHTIR